MLLMAVQGAGRGKAEQPPRPRHVPQRTCVACRRVEGKRSLVRLVRTEAGVVVDPGGKLAGRGMYLHQNRQCWQAALKGGRIEQALRTKLSAENRRALADYVQTLPESEELPEGPGGAAPPAL
jgi:predicted RNA-binding protein YlxR (DUF448 family)